MREYYEARAGEYDDWWLGTGLFDQRERPLVRGVLGVAGVLASLPAARTLALQGSTLYYTDSVGGTVSRVPADGSASPNQIASATSPRGLVADSSNVYWIDGSGATIMRVALSASQATTLATGQSATAIAQDGASIYRTNANAIMRMPK